MADEGAKAEAKVKSAVSSLGQGCVTLIAVYVGAVVVALVITQLQRQRTSNISTLGQNTPHQNAEVVVPNTDNYAVTEPSIAPSSLPSADIYIPVPTPSISLPTNPVPESAPDVPIVSRTGILTTQDADSSVNIREAPNLSAAILYEGYSGDTVTILNQSTDSEGITWYYVEFVNTNGAGWVHSNYVQIASPNVEPYVPSNVTVPAI